MVSEKYIVCDGPDGSGKSLFTEEAISWAEASGKRTLHLGSFWKEHGRHPEPHELDAFDVLCLREPTDIGAGAVVRHELTKNGTPYTSKMVADALSTDRVVLFYKVIEPARKRGMTIFSDRSFASSIVFQPIMDDTIGFEGVLHLPGHQLFLEKPMTDMLVLLVEPKEAMERLGNRRDKVDDTVFEKEELIREHNARYQSDWFKKIFSDRGVRLHYIDTTPLLLEESRSAIRTYIESVCNSSPSERS
ncbi:MAG: hypothetical protein UY95_C0033G0010 [Parcubacteria group bacterium GW2011_GWA2_56_7]|nr:MAG: hypothetical protein UY95_C0033G0010 [Parcubacteria group bacterium GW2011_GWA2_56_7]